MFWLVYAVSPKSLLGGKIKRQNQRTKSSGQAEGACPPFPGEESGTVSGLQPCISSSPPVGREAQMRPVRGDSRAGPGFCFHFLPTPC